MADTGSTVYGIDLGTTYSVLAHVDETGRAVVVRNGEGEETTPSVVHLESATNVVVGTQAKRIAKIEPENVVSLIKRVIGTEAVYSFHGQDHTPESLSALILKHIATGSETEEPVHDVVVTVPAYFGMRERDATRKAGEIAGLNVLGIVPEPVAAAVHYELTHDAVGRTVLVYDLGGGTFDTTVISVGDNAVEVLCTDGDKHLGGADWDARLADHIMDRFVEQAAPTDDPRGSDDLVQEVALLAEETKKQLSKHESRPVNLKLGGAAARFDVSRPDFEAMTEDLLDATVAIVRRTLTTLEELHPRPISWWSSRWPKSWDGHGHPHPGRSVPGWRSTARTTSSSKRSGTSPRSATSSSRRSPGSTRTTPTPPWRPCSGSASGPGCRCPRPQRSRREPPAATRRALPLRPRGGGPRRGRRHPRRPALGRCGDRARPLGRRPAPHAVLVTSLPRTGHPREPSGPGFR